MDKYQDGNKKEARRYYSDVLSCLRQGNEAIECLDIGSGIGFAFEKMVSQKFSGFSVDCIDRINAEEVNVPEYVRSYKQVSVEKRFCMDKKYDYIFCFEVIEHIDRTDILLKNCYDHLKTGGALFLSHPNLAGLCARMELLFGFQPHVLEVSNRYANYGTGVFGKMNNPAGNPIHHIRGITYRAMKEMLTANRFEIKKIFGSSAGGGILRYFPKISSCICYMCKKR